MWIVPAVVLTASIEGAFGDTREEMSLSTCRTRARLRRRYLMMVVGLAASPRES